MKKLIVLILSIIAIIPAFAKTQKESYNMQRAMDEAVNGSPYTAIEYFNKELADNPKNGYALLGLSIMQGAIDDYAECFEAVTNALQYLPQKDKGSMARAYTIRGKAYTALGDTIKGLEDYTLAINFDPKCEHAYEDRGEALYRLENYDESDKDYAKLLELNPGGNVPYLGLGRNAHWRGEYDKAIDYFNRVIKIFPDDDQNFAYRAQSFLAKGEYVKAAEDIIKALELDNSHFAFTQMFDFPVEQLPVMIAKLKAKGKEDSHNGMWNYYAGLLYEDKKMYQPAIDVFKNALETDNYYQIYKEISDCYEAMGNYTEALNYLDKAIQLREGDLNLSVARADMIGDMGDVDGAIKAWTEIIEQYTDLGGAYYRRGFFEDNSERTDDALADYEMAILLEPDYAYSYLGKGDMLMRKGETEKALEAYRKVVELDTIPGNSSCAMYALLAIGEKDQAIEFMDKVLEQDPDDPGNYYDAACFYSRIGELDKSLANLQTCIEKGFSRFHHIMADDDLEALRQTDGFKSLYEQNKDRFENCYDNPKEEVIYEDTRSAEIVEVPFTPEGGCASVKCSINELPLTFIFDTGASTVSMSQLEANFMLKNGYLKPEDIGGTKRFVDANGDISEGTIINLREVEFGGLKLKNVKASVVRNQKAPLLLGQSVLGRLGKIEIDNPNRKLIITQ